MEIWCRTEVEGGAWKRKADKARQARNYYDGYCFCPESQYCHPPSDILKEVSGLYQFLRRTLIISAPTAPVAPTTPTFCVAW